MKRIEEQACSRSSATERGIVAVRLVIGLLLLAAGGIFLADNLGWAHAGSLLRRLWPASLAAVGIAILLQPGSGRGRAWGWVWLFAGAWLWADQAGWITVDFWEVIFPVSLLLLGGMLVWRALLTPRGEASGSDADGSVFAFAIMAGNERRSSSSAFRGGDLGAFMGGVTLDLTEARIEGEAAEIDVFALWGAIEIFVPADWVVVGRVLPLMGAYEDKTRPAPVAGGASERRPRLIVRGMAIMGGVEVRVRS